MAIRQCRRHTIVSKTTLGTVACLLLLCICDAAILRGRSTPQSPRAAPRMLMMDTPSPTAAPSESPTPAPTRWPSPSPSEAPSTRTTPAPNEEPTLPAMPTPQITEPSTTPSVEPSFGTPSLTDAPTASASPSTEPRQFVRLADFGVEYVSGDYNDEASMQMATENYLLQTMGTQFESLASIELSQKTSRRQLQESTRTAEYSGTAVFGATPIPSTSEVQGSQTVVLRDTQALQAAYDEAEGVNVSVQNVVVRQPDPPPPSDDNKTNVGLIVGVALAAVVVVSLAMYAGCKWCKSKQDLVTVDLDSSKTSSPPRGGFYTPSDFEPAPTQSTSSPPRQQLDNSMEEDQSVEDQSVEVSIDMDEYSLSAASVDSSVKKDPEQRRESLLQKLALYQRTERRAATPAPPQQDAIMPTALFVPQVVARDASELTLTPKAGADPRVTAESRAVSLLDQSNSHDGNISEEEDSDEDILPPPVPHSTGNSSQWALETTGRELVSSDHGSKSQWSISPSEQLGEYESNMETQLVPVAPHGLPSTTWAHPFPMQGSQTRSYSDGPSDEMNAVMEQDLANFQLQPVVSPEQSFLQETPERLTDKQTPVRRTRSSSHEQQQHYSPPRQQAPPTQYEVLTKSSRARSTERRSSRSRRTDSSSQQDLPEVTPPRTRTSSSRSRHGLELKEVDPPQYAQRRRPRSTSKRHRGSKTNVEDDDVSFDGSYASNGSEVIEDLNGLSDFLRERREAKRAQRRERSEQRTKPSRR